MSTPQDPFATPGDDPQPGGTPPPHGQPGQDAPGGYGQPQYGQPAQPQYGGQPPYGQPAFGGHGPKKNGFGVAALVLGILALLGSITIVGGFLFGILAIIFGVLGRGRVKRGEADNGGMAITGLVLGALGLVISIVIVAAGVSFLSSESGQELQDCINDATTQSEIDQCRVQFEDSLTS